MHSGQGPGADGETARRGEGTFSPADAGRRLRNGLISLVLLLALVVGLLLAIPSLSGLEQALAKMEPSWLAAAVAFEVLSCVSYLLVFLQIFEHAPIRLGARIALTELAFNSAVSVGGFGSIAIGAWLLIERGAPGRM